MNNYAFIRVVHPVRRQQIGTIVVTDSERTRKAGPAVGREHQTVTVHIRNAGQQAYSGGMPATQQQIASDTAQLYLVIISPQEYGHTTNTKPVTVRK